MRMDRHVGGVALAALVFAGAGIEAQETHRVSGDHVAIYNLAGRVDVVAGTGADVVVRLTRGGGDAAELRVETGMVGGRNALRVIYPGDEIVYAGRAGSGRSRFQSDVRVRSDGTFGDGGRGGQRVTVRSGGGGGGVEAWADLRIEVPRGRTVEIHQVAGDAQLRGIEGSLDVEIGAGAVDAAGMRGSLSVDTGSGQITLSDVDGDVTVDTGSGRVELSQVRGPSVLVDTGSGAVVGTDITSPALRVDTGSGSIRLARVSSARVVLDTGSGSVELGLLGRVDEVLVDTGSGSVTLMLPAGAGAEILAETGSGGIDVDIPVQIRSVERDHLSGVIGDGRGRIEIDTGSGRIRIASGG